MTNKFETAKGAISRARAAVKSAESLKGYERRRTQLVHATLIAREIARSQTYKRAFENKADARGIAPIRAGSAPHLRLLRYLNIVAPAPSLKRYSDVIEKCLASGWSSSEIKQRFRDGIHPILQVRKIKRRPISSRSL